MSLKKIEQHRAFNGEVTYYEHHSKTCNSKMTFAVFIPEQAKTKPVPAIYFLSGLTCTHENFITKAGAIAHAAKHSIALILPDTSPRGVNITGADKTYDLGYGAGFYVNATQTPWAEHFQMYDYITDELPTLCQQNLPITDQASIMGHSMGGHGAIMIALRNPTQYQSVSAFSPICAPMQCPWGVKAFTAYLGEDQTTWATYDSYELIKSGNAAQLPLLIDQGDADEFLKPQLCLDKFEQICKTQNYPAKINLRKGYDHSYYFISSFVGEHLEFHAEHLTDSII